MKNLICLSMLTLSLACGSTQTTELKTLDNSDLPANQRMSTENNVEICNINWTDDMLAEISAANDMDKPLPIDLNRFRSQAHHGLQGYFGNIGQGKVVYQDMYGTASNALYDLTRVYYVAELPAELGLGSDISAAYAASTSGELLIGFVKKDERSNYYDFRYPGLLSSFDRSKVSREDFLDFADKLQKTVAPDLNWTFVSAGIVGYYLAVQFPNNPSAIHMEQFIKVWMSIAEHPALSTIETDGEAVGGTATHSPMIEISDSVSSIDMNGLRNYTLARANEGAPFFTLPSLAKPFGLGCRVPNPLLAN